MLFNEEADSPVVEMTGDLNGTSQSEVGNSKLPRRKESKAERTTEEENNVVSN